MSPNLGLGYDNYGITVLVGSWLTKLIKSCYFVCPPTKEVPICVTARWTDCDESHL